MTRVAVLYGGISAEREVSLASGTQCIAALREAGFEVTPIDVGADLAAVIAALDAAKPDVVFNALHGRFGEDGASRACSTGCGCPTPIPACAPRRSPWTSRPPRRCSPPPACRSARGWW